MKRREFLAASAGVILGGSTMTSVVAAAVESTPKVVDWTLKFEEVLAPGHFVERWWRISKGPYSAKLTLSQEARTDLYDSHGLCVIDELAGIIKNELEIGPEGFETLWESDLRWDSQEYKELKKSLTHVEISEEELRQIVEFLKGSIGPHNCVHQNRL